MRCVLSFISRQPPRYAEDSSDSISCGVPTDDHAPVQHDGGAVGDAEDDAGELLDHQHRDAGAGQIAHLLVQLLDDQRRQAHRQLVEQQHRRVGRQAPGQGEHLLLAARQRARPPGRAARRGGGSARRRRPRCRRRAARAWVAMRRFSRTVRFGKMPRPSGTRHSPARARSSARAPLTRRPATRTSPPVGGCRPARTLQGRGLAGAVRARARPGPRPAGRRGRRRGAPRCAP